MSEDIERAIDQLRSVLEDCRPMPDRDRFAMVAMRAVVWREDGGEKARAARQCYQIADAMLAARVAPTLPLVGRIEAEQADADIASRAATLVGMGYEPGPRQAAPNHRATLEQIAALVATLPGIYPSLRLDIDVTGLESEPARLLRSLGGKERRCKPSDGRATVSVSLGIDCMAVDALYSEPAPEAS